MTEQHAARIEAGRGDLLERPPCPDCDGRGWLGAATGSMFASIGQLAMAGRLPKRECTLCGGTGRAKLARIAREVRDGG